MPTPEVPAVSAGVSAGVALPAVPAVPVQLPAVGAATALSLQGMAPTGDVAEPPPAPLIPGLAPKAQRLWTAGKVLNVIGASVGMAGTGLAGASGVITGIYGLNDTSTVGSLGPLFTQVGSGANMGALALNIVALGLQHGALSSAGSDPSRKKFIGGIVVGALGLAGVITGFVFAGMKDNPNASTIAFAVTSGGTSLLTSSNSVFIADGVNVARAYKSMFLPPSLPALPELPGLPTVPQVGLPNVPQVGLPAVPPVALPNVPAAGMPTVPPLATP